MVLLRKIWFVNSSLLVQGKLSFLDGSNILTHNQHHRDLLVIAHGLGGFPHPDDAAYLPAITESYRSGWPISARQAVRFCRTASRS